MAYSVVLSKEEQQKNNQLFLQYQKEYNETHDKSILWNKMEPLLRVALAAAILKNNNNKPVKNFEDKIADGIIILIRRYVKNPDYNFGSLPTLVYYAALSVNKSKQVIFEERNVIPLEELESWQAKDYPIE